MTREELNEQKQKELIKEENKEKPYFAMKIETTEYLQVEN